MLIFVTTYVATDTEHPWRSTYKCTTMKAMCGYASECFPQSFSARNKDQKLVDHFLKIRSISLGY